ncbi:hypothetical protein [Aureimonas populi]|uniref:Uncharacterized protein n=1 Tax=Aureimonas populi TaxID=1701758 RepID=A0ABW5CK90_9HYPH|nr:hypothetical protein [Aureimonas populi]
MEETMVSASAIERMERTLRGAARAYVAALKAAETQGDHRRETRGVLAALGFTLDEIALAQQAGAPPPGFLLPRIREALDRELRRLAREVRAGRAGYDINRHIAARRVWQRLFGPAKEAATAPRRGPRVRPRRRAARAGPPAP